ncbi:hypothetical protein DL89DRAFT_290287 [Linderina pennispora]|uniref:Uncharacterized protein n=1 Tax=Linderina pennispora TaxID=61395 RepID=A0A1Y1WMR7_9FUNG|nr:uncharacterized protein DL89DRAFT_290287 [Linderina pennispora]ORX74813.1 hypothetical protein DL89DRAFT_290287 [Linderina pennispora]
MSSTPSKAPDSSTSSTSTSSAPASADPIQNASKKAFHSSALYLQSELEARLNDAAISKYEGQTYKEMEMQLAEIDDLVASVDSLEQMAQELDAYSLQLETRFKNLLNGYKVKPEALEAVFKKAWAHDNTGIKPDALALSSEFMTLFIKEALERAKAKHRESGSTGPIDESHLEKILAQLLLDF